MACGKGAIRARRGATESGAVERRRHRNARDRQGNCLSAGKLFRHAPSPRFRRRWLDPFPRVRFRVLRDLDFAHCGPRCRLRRARPTIQRKRSIRCRSKRRTRFSRVRVLRRRRDRRRLRCRRVRALRHHRTSWSRPRLPVTQRRRLTRIRPSPHARCRRGWRRRQSRRLRTTARGSVRPKTNFTSRCVQWRSRTPSRCVSS